ncbi:hypothetical protein N800_05740 [Lysobacter daejeonensis GH1-9]|uniref:Uncharacterized protein n=1 Tax=Lysobacter daejeonensis GH1-9 TaxID=1385517 RepID=A0A0A0EUZ0_9GAMM|nr:hypothetical protein [Lysobacter daejeonensis]KGM54075.1 hypothetical protein N800_05740 [Lysobacter daejeonensis GH1-9]
MSGVPPAEDHEAGASDVLGRDVLAQVSMDRIAAQLGDLPTAALLQSLGGILDALDGADATRAARRVGVIGRLLGRDLVARAHPDPTEARVRVHLAHAATQATQLECHLVGLQATVAQLESSTRRLQALVDGRQAMAAAEAYLGGESGRRRLAYLAAIVDSWRVSAAQLHLAIGNARQLLERHGQVRDFLVPLWRQQATAAEVGRRLRDQDASRAADLRHSLRRLLETLGTATPDSPTVNSAPPAEREPLP